jgi:hypothetical protein
MRDPDRDMLENDPIFREGLDQNAADLSERRATNHGSAHRAQAQQALKTQQKYIGMYQRPPEVGAVVQVQLDRRMVTAMQSSAINAVVMAQLHGARNRKLATFWVATSWEGRVSGSFSAADFRLVAAGADGKQPHPGHVLQSLQRLATAGGGAPGPFPGPSACVCAADSQICGSFRHGPGPEPGSEAAAAGVPRTRRAKFAAAARNTPSRTEALGAGGAGGVGVSSGNRELVVRSEEHQQ